MLSIVEYKYKEVNTYRQGAECYTRILYGKYLVLRIFLYAESFKENYKACL